MPPKYLAYVLAYLYLFLCQLTFVQIARILYYRHNIFSFQFGFLILCLLWTALRVVFWLKEVQWNQSVELFIQWLPLNLQVATFSLLVVFYAHVYHRQKWHSKYRFWFMTAYAVSNLTLLCMTIGWIVFLGVSRNGAGYEQYAQLFFGVWFFFLVTCIAVYGIKLARLMRSSKLQVPFQAGDSRSTCRILSMTLVIFLVFTSRFIYNIMSASNAKFAVRIRRYPDIDPLVFVLLVVWEIFPTLLVLIICWRVPRTQIGLASLATRAMKPESASPFLRDSEIGARGRHRNLFDNPRRYDSDDEGTFIGTSVAESPAFGTPSCGSPGFFHAGYNGSFTGQGGAAASSSMQGGGGKYYAMNEDAVDEQPRQPES